VCLRIWVAARDLELTVKVPPLLARDKRSRSPCIADQERGHGRCPLLIATRQQAFHDFRSTSTFQLSLLGFLSPPR